MTPTPNGFRTAQVSVGTTATLLCAARADRRAVTIEDLGSTDVYIGDANVTTGNGILLPGGAGSSITIPTTAAIYGIVGTGTQTVGVAETYS
jgi:hypothetical protein